MQRKIVPHLVNNQALATLEPTATVRQAAKAMAERHIGAVLVVADGRLAGIFTERDVLSRVVARGLDPNDTALGTVMTPDPDTVSPDDTAFAALERMASRGYRHLPVVDASGTTVGIVSIRDLYDTVKRELEEDLQRRDALIFDTGYGAG